MKPPAPPLPALVSAPLTFTPSAWLPVALR